MLIQKKEMIDIFIETLENIFQNEDQKTTLNTTKLLIKGYFDSLSDNEYIDFVDFFSDREMSLYHTYHLFKKSNKGSLRAYLNLVLRENSSILEEIDNNPDFAAFELENHGYVSTFFGETLQRIEDDKFSEPFNTIYKIFKRDFNLKKFKSYCEEYEIDRKNPTQEELDLIYLKFSND